jgi:hypothetical protein
MILVEDSDSSQEHTGMVCDSNISVSAIKQFLGMDWMCVS